MSKDSWERIGSGVISMPIPIVNIVIEKAYQRHTTYNNCLYLIIYSYVVVVGGVSQVKLS